MIIAIKDLPGINTLDVKKLEMEGIKTNIDLLKKTIDSEKQQQLANKLQVNLKLLKKWIALADLSRLQSINHRYCGLILHSGIICTQQLSKVDAPTLHRQILRLQVATLKRKDLCPSLSLIQQWIKEAKKLRIKN